MLRVLFQYSVQIQAICIYMYVQILQGYKYLKQNIFALQNFN